MKNGTFPIKNKFGLSQMYEKIMIKNYKECGKILKRSKVQIDFRKRENEKMARNGSY